MWFYVPWWLPYLYKPWLVVSDLAEWLVGEFWIWMAIPMWLVVFLLGALLGGGIVWIAT